MFQPEKSQGDTQERQQNQQTAVITQILAVAGTGDCNADISYYKKENGNWELKWTEKGYVGRNGITDNKKKETEQLLPACTPLIWLLVF